MYTGVYAGQTPERPAVIMSDTGATLTFAELEDRSARIARLFHDRGQRRGDVVAGDHHPPGRAELQVPAVPGR